MQGSQSAVEISPQKIVLRKMFNEDSEEYSPQKTYADARLEESKGFLNGQRKTKDTMSIEVIDAKSDANSPSGLATYSIREGPEINVQENNFRDSNDNIVEL